MVHKIALRYIDLTIDLKTNPYKDQLVPLVDTYQSNIELVHQYGRNFKTMNQAFDTFKHPFVFGYFSPKTICIK